MLMYFVVACLPPATKLGQGNIFRSVCQEFCPHGGHVWQGGMHGTGDMHGGGHVWQGGVCMTGEVCVAGGMHGSGGVHGRGVCMVGEACMADTMRYGQ